MRSVETQPTNGHVEVFKLLADAVHEHLHSAVDADTVREINLIGGAPGSTKDLERGTAFRSPDCLSPVARGWHEGS